MRCRFHSSYSFLGINEIRVWVLMCFTQNLNQFKSRNRAFAGIAFLSPVVKVVMAFLRTENLGTSCG